MAPGGRQVKSRGTSLGLLVDCSSGGKESAGNFEMSSFGGEMQNGMPMCCFLDRETGPLTNDSSAGLEVIVDGREMGRRPVMRIYGVNVHSEAKYSVQRLDQMSMHCLMKDGLLRIVLGVKKCSFSHKQYGHTNMALSSSDHQGSVPSPVAAVDEELS